MSTTRPAERHTPAKRGSAQSALKALALALAAAASGFAAQIPGAAAQGWWDRGDDRGLFREGPRSGRDFDVYPDDYSDADIEEAERDRRFGRRYAPSRRWNERDFDGDDGDDDDDDDDDDNDPIDNRRGGRSAMRGSGNGGDFNANVQRPAKPSAPLTGEFAPGSRPVIYPKAPPLVAFSSTYPAGSVVIDTSARKLYYVRGRMSAYAYPIGVGREGFAWVGSEKVSRVADWPDWYPPAEMRKRQPNLPQRMIGGLNNPLGAKAIYLGNTLYRIHGTNDPKSIGRAQSSGCFRMMNEHVAHLASQIKVGTPVTVVRSLGHGVKIVTAPGGNARSRLTARNERDTPVRRPPRIRWSDDPDPYPYDGGDYGYYSRRYR